MSVVRLNRILMMLAFAAVAAGCRGPEAYIKSGDELLAQKKYREAILEYQNAIAKDKLNGEAHYKIAKAWVASGSVMPAQKAVGNMTAIDASSPDSVVSV